MTIREEDWCPACESYPCPDERAHGLVSYSLARDIDKQIKAPRTAPWKLVDVTKVRATGPGSIERAALLAEIQSLAAKARESESRDDVVRIIALGLLYLQSADGKGGGQ